MYKTCTPALATFPLFLLITSRNCNPLIVSCQQTTSHSRCKVPFHICSVESEERQDLLANCVELHHFPHCQLAPILSHHQLFGKLAEVLVVISGYFVTAFNRAKISGEPQKHMLLHVKYFLFSFRSGGHFVPYKVRISTIFSTRLMYQNDLWAIGHLFWHPQLYKYTSSSHELNDYKHLQQTLKICKIGYQLGILLLLSDVVFQDIAVSPLRLVFCCSVPSLFLQRCFGVLHGSS